MGGGVVKSIRRKLITITASLIIFTLMFCSFIAGQLLSKQEAYGITNVDAPTAVGEVYKTVAADEVISIKRTGIYSIVVSGEPGSSAGGEMAFTMKLSKGEKLVTFIAYGGPAKTEAVAWFKKGGNAMGVCLGSKAQNNILAMSSGGSGEAYDAGRNYYYSVPGGYGYYVKTSDGISQIGNTGYTSKMFSIDSQVSLDKTMSAGYAPGMHGTSTQGPVDGRCANNFIDATKVIDYENKADVSSECALKISYLEDAPADNETEGLNALNTTVKNGLAQINTTLESQQFGNSQMESLTVLAGENFSEFVRIVNDTTVGGTSEGITVINNNSLDKVVRISGKIDESGEYQVNIDGVIYTIKVVSEPTSSNVSAVF